MSKLIAETGKCKLNAFDYPVRIYATDGGVNSDLIFGDCKCLHGRMLVVWNKHGKCVNLREGFDLIPIPESQYFNIYTDDDGTVVSVGKVYVGKVHNALELALAQKLSKNGTTYKYTDGVIEKVEELDNEI